jgi:ABC-type amino acid transport substrate-binding protein
LFYRTGGSHGTGNSKRERIKNPRFAGVCHGRRRAPASQAHAGRRIPPFLAFRFRRRRGRSPAQSPTQQNAEQQQPTPPARLSPEDSVAPRTSVDTLAEIKKNGKLRVGISMIIPWAMHDKDGNLIGFEIDVAKKMARDLGVDVKFYPDEFHYLIPDLLDGRFDVIISGFSLSTNRAMQVNFSAPYNFTDLSLAANRKLAGGFKTLAEFDKATVTIGVLDTSTAVDVT